MREWENEREFNGEQRGEGGSMEMKEAWKIMARDEHDPEEKNDIIIIILSNHLINTKNSFFSQVWSKK